MALSFVNKKIYSHREKEAIKSEDQLSNKEDKEQKVTPQPPRHLKVKGQPYSVMLLNLNIEMLPFVVMVFHMLYWIHSL